MSTMRAGGSALTGVATTVRRAAIRIGSRRRMLFHLRLCLRISAVRQGDGAVRVLDRERLAHQVIAHDGDRSASGVDDLCRAADWGIRKLAGQSLTELARVGVLDDFRACEGTRIRELS